MPAPQNKYMVQIVWGRGGRMKEESLPGAFPATVEGYTAMRTCLLACVTRLDRILAQAIDEAQAAAATTKEEA